MMRTLSLAADYQGDLDATLLINCLLGLLIVPNESLIERIPKTEFSFLSAWGIQPSSIKNFGKCAYGPEHQPNLRQLVQRLRNAVAHFKIGPIHGKNKVVGFSFRDRNGFHADLSLGEIRKFVICLSTYLKDNIYLK